MTAPLYFTESCAKVCKSCMNRVTDYVHCIANHYDCSSPLKGCSFLTINCLYLNSSSSHYPTPVFAPFLNLILFLFHFWLWPKNGILSIVEFYSNFGILLHILIHFLFFSPLLNGVKFGILVHIWFWSNFGFQSKLEFCSIFRF